MSTSAVVCPNCQSKISVSQAFSKEIELSAQSRVKELQLKFGNEMRTVQELKVKNAAEAKELAAQRKELEEEIEERVAEQAKLAKRKLELKVRSEMKLELQEREQIQAEQEAKVTEYRQSLLDAKESNRKLLEEKNEAVLNAQKLVDERVAAAAQAATEQMNTAHLLEVEKYRLSESSLRTKLDEMQRRLSQGSQQAQGEVLENALEQILRNSFPMDEIKAVPKGKNGMDISQFVSHRGKVSGEIAWESKNARDFGKDWVSKLKEDMRSRGSLIGVIVTQAMPKDTSGVIRQDGVWICDLKSAAHISLCLRELVIAVESSRVVQEGKVTKAEKLYDLFTSPKAKHAVEYIFNSWVTMQSDLESERTAINKMWKKRGAQIEGMKDALGSLLDDVELIVDASEAPELNASNDVFALL